ncbi:g7130 [Coccomyxa elongata]
MWVDSVASLTRCDRVMATPWSLRLHLEGIDSLNEEERGEVYEALKGYDRADRRELFLKVDAATLKDLGVLDPIVRQAILASVGGTGSAAVAPIGTPADRTSYHVDQLFAPFSTDDFPHRLDVPILRAMLQRPLHRLPVTQAHDKTELNYTHFWDEVGFRLPEWAKRYINFQQQVHRGTEHTSINSAKSKRDYLLTILNINIIGTEDKPDVLQLGQAEKDLLSKHAGSNAALHGRLSYIMLIATAGSYMKVFAMPIVPNATLQVVVDKMEVASSVSVHTRSES